MFGKMLCIVLAAAICVFICVTAVAGAGESGIVFRNIPWGSSVKEVEALLGAELDDSVSLRKTAPVYLCDRPELGCYYNYNSDELEYYETPGGGLRFQGVYVDELHFFFRNDRLVQAAYFFRTDPENLKAMSGELDEQYGPHTLSVTKQVTDVDLYTWEMDGRTVTAEAIQIESDLLGYYSDFIIIYSDGGSVQ